MKIKTCFTIIVLLLFSGVLCFGAADAQNKEKSEITQSNVTQQGVTQPDVAQPGVTQDIQKDIKDAPLAVAPESVYTFESALDGDEVLHDFIIQNKGTAELKIERVKTG